MFLVESDEDYHKKQANRGHSFRINITHCEQGHDFPTITTHTNEAFTKAERMDRVVVVTVPTITTHMKAAFTKAEHGSDGQV
eukprot:scaffold23638_cov113-Cylindrotheca_fusiformis.AAC.1